ncbi:MAG: RecX family transcriptional regulator [Bacteroidota bacterium]
MVVTRVLRQRAKIPKYSVYLDGKYEFDVSDSTRFKFGINVGREMNSEILDKAKEAELFYQGQRVAINFVSYRPRSSREVMVRLNQKGFPLGVAQRVVQHFESVSLVNDGEFARMFVRDKLKAKHVGRALLKQLLYAKGISRQLIDEVLGEYVTEENQQRSASELAAKKLKLAARSFSKLDRMKQRKRLIDFLLRKGFSSDIAFKTVKAVLAAS